LLRQLRRPHVLGRPRTSGNDKLGRHADAEALVGKTKVDFGDVAAYQYAGIYAQWGNTSAALDWLETAFRLRDDGLLGLKTDPLLDPVRKVRCRPAGRDQLLSGQMVCRCCYSGKFILPSNSLYCNA
jgi:hypothetical protein